MTAANTPQVVVSDACIIEVPNWKKFNPRPDRVNFSWFRMENNFFHDQAIFHLNNEQKLIYLFILCEASKKNTETVKLSSRYVSAVISSTPEKVQQSFKYLADLELIKMTEINVPANPCGVMPASCRQNDVITPSKWHTTNVTNVTNETKRERETEKKVALLHPLSLIWNEFSNPSLARVIKTERKRLKRCEECWREHPDSEFWKKLILENVNTNEFFLGKNLQGWKIDFDFFLKPDKLIKIQEGGYANTAPGLNNGAEQRSKRRHDVFEQYKARNAAMEAVEVGQGGGNHES